MSKQFFIKKICKQDIRPAHHHAIEVYFEDFVHEHILTPYNIIIDTHWCIVLSVMFFTKTESGLDGINIFEPSAIDEKAITYYPVTISYEQIFKDNHVVENLISLYYQVISLFFINNYKSIPADALLVLKDKIDWDYLLSLPYPAAYAVQKYVGDDIPQ